MGECAREVTTTLIQRMSGLHKGAATGWGALDSQMSRQKLREVGKLLFEQEGVGRAPFPVPQKSSAWLS